MEDPTPVNFPILAEIITKQSGRYDLVGTKVVSTETVPDYTVDAGMLQKIYAAVQSLEEAVCVKATRRRRVFDLDSGDYVLSVPGYIRMDSGKRSLSVTMSGETTALELVSEDDMLEEYEPFSEVAVGTPAYICAYSYDDVTVPMTADSTNFVVLPPPEADATISISGWFRTTRDTTGVALDSNWWVLTHQDAVVNLTIQIIERGVMNPITDSTIGMMLAEIKKQVLSADINDEIARLGTQMRG